MKLKNKKTGEIIDITCHKTGDFREKIDSLAELNAEWEDYEEPKEYWFIKDGDCIDHCLVELGLDIDRHKSVGNYFDTREEAEKAVEKLKAWKRLKDNGFKFDEWGRDKRFSGDYIIKASDYYTCDDKDLDLLFGGENEKV